MRPRGLSFIFAQFAQPTAPRHARVSPRYFNKNTHTHTHARGSVRMSKSPKTQLANLPSRARGMAKRAARRALYNKAQLITANKEHSQRYRALSLSLISIQTQTELRVSAISLLLLLTLSRCVATRSRAALLLIRIPPARLALAATNSLELANGNFQ